MNKIRFAFVAVLFLFAVGSFCRADGWPGFRGAGRDGRSAETGLLRKWPRGGPKAVWVRSGIGTGYSSPAISKGTIYVTGLVEKEGLVTAFDLKGNVKWTSNYGSEWSGPMAGVRSTPTIDDERGYIISGMGKVSCFDTATGELLWKDEHSEYQEKVNGVNPVSPVYYDGCIFTTSGYDDGSAMLQLNADGSGVSRKWTETTLDCHHGGVVLVDGFIFGSNYFSVYDGGWVCLNWADGREMYLNRWNNKGSILFADGMLYCYDEKDGEVALVRPDPAGFEPVSSFEVPFGVGKHWAHPAISDGKLYIRHGDVLGVYAIKKTGWFGLGG